MHKIAHTGAERTSNNSENHKSVPYQGTLLTPPGPLLTRPGGPGTRARGSARESTAGRPRGAQGRAGGERSDQLLGAGQLGPHGHSIYTSTHMSVSDMSVKSVMLVESPDVSVELGMSVESPDMELESGMSIES